MHEQELGRLVADVKDGRLSPCAFVRQMVALGLTAPMAAAMLAHAGVARAQSDFTYAPTRRGEFSSDMQMHTTTMTQPDPEVFMDPFTSAEVASKDNQWQGRNITRWRSDEYDSTFKAAEAELDPIKRAALFVKLNELVIEAVAVIPVVYRPGANAVHDKPKALLSGWDSEFYSLQSWYRET